MKKNKLRKGFTLVEILVTISILVSISAMLTRMLFNFTRDAFVITSQMKSNKMLTDAINRIEGLKRDSVAILPSYNIGVYKPSTPLKYCPSCITSNKVLSTDKAVVLVVPVPTRCTTGGTCTIGMQDYEFQDVSVFRNSLKGGYLTADPYYEAPVPDSSTNSLPNDVVILYKDDRILETNSASTLRMAQFISGRKDSNSVQYSREMNQGNLLKTDINSIKIASNILNGRSSVPTQYATAPQAVKDLFITKVFTYLTDGGELPYTGTPFTIDQAKTIRAIKVTLVMKDDFSDVKVKDNNLKAQSKEAVFKLKPL